MTVETAGFLQNLAGTNAVTFRQYTGAPFAAAGVLSPYELEVVAGSGMNVVVGAGRALISGGVNSAPTSPRGKVLPFTAQGLYFALNDASVTVAISTSNSTNPRIDAIWVRVQDSFYSGTTNAASVGATTGTPASTPVTPSIPAGALLLATVLVPANSTSISGANITDARSLAVAPAAPTLFVASGAPFRGATFNPLIHKQVIWTQTVVGTVDSNGYLNVDISGANLLGIQNIEVSLGDVLNIGKAQIGATYTSLTNLSLNASNTSNSGPGVGMVRFNYTIYGWVAA